MAKKTTEQFIEDSKKKFGDKFDYSKCNYINNETSIILRCKKHNLEFNVLPKSHLYKKGGCKLCADENRRNASKTKTTEQFIEDSKKKFGDKFDYSKCEYKGAYKEVKLICKKCREQFTIIAHNHLNSNDGGCKICAIEKVSNAKRLTQEEILDRCKEIEGYDYSKIKYIDAYTKIEIVCKKHGSFWKLPYNFYGNKQGCPACNQSKLEKVVEDYLIKNNIQYERYKDFEELVDVKKLNYDFYLPTENVLIECQGIQHYEYVDFFHKNLHEFHKQLHHDWLKRKYARDNDIKLICVPYWEIS